MFSQEYKIVEQSLLKIGIELTDEYDGFIVKELKAVEYIRFRKNNKPNSYSYNWRTNGYFSIC